MARLPCRVRERAGRRRGVEEGLGEGWEREKEGEEEITNVCQW